MKKFTNFILIVFFIGMKLYSNPIILGHEYNSVELQNLKGLQLVYSIKLKSKEIDFLGFEKKSASGFYDEKILLVKTNNNNNIYAEGIYLTDQDSLFSLYVDEENCVFKLRNLDDRNEPKNLLYVITDKEAVIRKFQIPINFIASLVFNNEKVYLSTEYYDSDLVMFDLKTEKLEYLNLKKPNSQLKNIANDLILGKTINNELFLINAKEIIFLNEEIFNEVSIKDYQ